MVSFEVDDEVMKIRKFDNKQFLNFQLIFKAELVIPFFVLSCEDYATVVLALTTHCDSIHQTDKHLFVTNLTLT